jgi:hypothetical protein
MSILDSILGGGGSNDSQQNDVNASMTDTSREFAANPNLQFGASDVLHSWNESHESDNGDMESDASSFTGIGDVGLSVGAPIYASDNSSTADYSSSQSDQDGGGGLLSGLL